MTTRSTGTPRRRSVSRPLDKPYTLLSRAPDGRLHVERFESAAAYRNRLLASTSNGRPVSADELINLLEFELAEPFGR